MAEIYKSKFPGQEIDERLELIPELQEGVVAAQQAADGKYTKPASGIPMTDLSDEVQEAIEEGGGQADWAQTDTTAQDYIKNKPSIPTHVVRFAQQFLSESEQIQARANIGAGTYTKPSGGIPESDLADDVIPDVSDFITNTVNNLVNYYLKSETYSRSEVQQLIAAIQGVSFVSVASLPTPSADTMGGKIYLVPSANPDEQNVKDEFITIQDGNTYTWEPIGSTAVNLSGYVTTQQLNNALAAYTTTEALTTLLAAKQDTISDLSAIRSGAAAGATAYQKPQTGIPETDLASGVQSALALARTSIQSLADYYDKTEIDSLLAAVNSQEYVDVATLPTASASTLGKIYLVGPTDNQYDRYYTSYDGSAYSWVAAGSTEINLSNYATKAELNQLDQETNKIDKQAGGGQRANYVSGGYISTQGRYYARSGWNITDFIPYTGGTIVWRFGQTDHIDSYYPSLVFFDANEDYINYYSSVTYTDDRTVTPSIEGVAYIRASFSDMYKGKDNLTPLTINGVDWDRKDEIKPLSIDKAWKPLPLGKLIQGQFSASTGNVVDGAYSEYFVVTQSMMTVPFEGAKLRFFSPLTIPYLMSIQVVYCSSNGGDGRLGAVALFGPYSDEVTLPTDAKAFRLQFRARFRYGATGANNWEKLTLASVEQMLEAGTLGVEYYDDENGVLERNEPKETKVGALRRVLNLDPISNNGMDLLPVFAHISDLHGDALRFRNYMEYCDSIGIVDFALNSGDATMYDHNEQSQYIDAIADKFKTPMLFCIGNHESWPTGQSTLFADNIQGLVERQGYLSAANTPTNKCYYYRDFDAKKVRVIALNYYEDGVYNGRIGQTQIDWFISVLSSTPTGYGIIVMLHSPEDSVSAPTEFNKFMQPSPKYGDTYQPNGFYVGNRPISTIIDTFISRGTLSTSYNDHSATYNGSSNTSTEVVTINADFRNIDPSIEFIAYCCGHRHEDNIGYYTHSTNKQLCLGVVCGIALFGNSSNSAWANQCDLPRGGKGTVQDAFNLYAIDRTGGNIRVVRVGADTTILFAHRDMMIIPYKD